MALYRNVSWDEFNSLGTGLPTPSQTRLYNALGRNSESSDDNFFTKRAKSIDNAIGTTGAAVVSAIDSAIENKNNEERNKRWNQSMDDIYKSAGYDNMDDYYNAKDEASRNAFNKIGFDYDAHWDNRANADLRGDKETVARLDQEYQDALGRLTGEDADIVNRFENIQNQLKNQASANAGEAKKAAQDWKDYRENSDVGKRVNQDRGKFLGSAINTLSTAFDVMAPGAGVLANSVQGGIEGIADELEQNGLENFDWGRAGQNALTGATVGAVTGGLNKGISNQLAKNGGNLFKGGNMLTRGLNNLGSSTTAGQIGSTLATGAARGAVSGAVGGATGAGLSAAMNGQDILGSAIQGAQQGFGQGALAGSVMAGANMAANATPGVGNVMRKFNKAGENFNNSGDNTIDRIKNTWNSGESPVANIITEDINAVKQGFQNVGEGIKTLSNRDRTGVLNSLQNVGMGIKNVAEVETIPQDIQNMKINNPYADGIYKTVPAEEVNVQKANNSATTPANAENTLKTSKSEQLRYKAAQELLKQYGTVDKPTAKATNAPKTIQEIADAGFTKPGDVERIADNITGSNGEVNKLVQNLVSTAKRVNTFDGLDGKTIDEFIDESIARNALDGINEGKAVKSQIKAYLNSLDSRRNGSVDWSDNPEDVMDVVRGLEAEAANYEGRSGMNYGTTTQDKMNAAKVAKDVATLLKDRVFETVDVKSAMTPEVGESLKALAPGNKEWANYVDNKIMTAKNVQDLRSVQAPFVRAKKIIDNGYMNSVTYGGRLGNSTNAIPTTKSGIVRDVVNNTLNSNIANRAKAKALNKAADIADRFSGNNAGGGDVVTGGSVNGSTMALPSGEVSGQTYNPSTRIYDMIGRTEGLNNAEQARTADYLINAAQEAEIVPSNSGNTLETLISQPSTSNTGVYNTIYGNQSTGMANNTQMPNNQSATQSNSGYFPVTGDYWTDVLGRAMSAAIDADDVDAFASLYSMYQDSVSNLRKQSSNGKDYSNITNWNSSDRSKLLSAQDAMSQIDQLESAYNTATGGQGGNFLQGNLRSLAANISGGNLDASANNYNKLAESVGMGIVKNLINLGVTESDAKRYLEYLPSLTDTKEQASQKLATLRNIYQSQMNNLYSAYGV